VHGSPSQFLWAKPFTLLSQLVDDHFTRFVNGRLETSPSYGKLVDNLITMFIEYFTDIDSLENSSSQLCKKYSKKFPFDYSLYLKEIHFKEIQDLTAEHFRFKSAITQFRIVRLASGYCPNLKTLSFVISMYQSVDFCINIDEKWTLPCLRNLSLSIDLNDRILSTLSRTAHNLESISLEYCLFVTGYSWLENYYQFAEQEPYHHELQKLIQSQRQLKTIAMKFVVIKMSSLFKLLESQSNSLESIVLEDCSLHPDDLNIEPINFHQLTSISIKKSLVSKGGLKLIIEADLPKLQQIKFEDTEKPEDWILL